MVEEAAEAEGKNISDSVLNALGMRIAELEIENAILRANLKNESQKEK